MIENFKMINCILNDSDIFFSLNAIFDILIYNLSIIDIEIFNTPNLIFILSERGGCEIVNLNIDNNKFYNKEIEHPIIDI